MALGTAVSGSQCLGSSCKMFLATAGPSCWISSPVLLLHADQSLPSSGGSERQMLNSGIMQFKSHEGTRTSHTLLIVFIYSQLFWCNDGLI